MARQKEFDREEVLQKAMETFWRLGYEKTSVQNLVESMGINRGSLYDTFGDKRSLFLETIAHYDSTLVQKAIARFQAPEAGKQAIIDHFYSLVDRIVADSERRGCLLTNSAVELCNRDSETAAKIQANLQKIENALKQALTRAQTKGELTASHDIDALARFLTCSLQGLRVIGKLNPDPDLLRDIVKVTLSVLD